ncbi:unnamed protein product [Rhizopus stolonifer]
MEHIQNNFLSDFDTKSLAQEIAHINIQLLQLADLDPHWLQTLDKRANLIPLLDFHRYLSHAFAHEIIYSANPELTITQLIQIASKLFHSHRDLSGSTAILICLKMPEIQRLEHAWEQCTPRTIQCLHSLLPLLSPGRRIFMRDAVVPFAQAHLGKDLEFCLKQKKPKDTLSNPRIYHWLVSRAYLDRSQLCCESLQVVPLAQGEVLDSEEEHDFYYDFYRVEEKEDVEDEPSDKVPKRALSIKSTDSEEEEEWTGYPGEESPVEDVEEEEEEEEEEWTGYPVSSSEEEEEGWKGYPQEITTQSWQTPFDPWGKNYRLHAIEKTRRMQYSLSNSIIARKRISSSLVHSSASA